ncbi:MAG: tripartite tricarboxylate transporter substrate binding protein [Betaproteobacteria bacterium]|nr:tripartite tricarboxylate transporter substrate binding protein [Betaproteobacteria bacterium]
MKSVAPLFALAVSAVFAANAQAQKFPDHPITMIVPWAAGGSTDQTGRALAKAAEPHLGKPVIIINKPGASTTIGMAELARAKPDGYTIGTLSSSSYLLALQGRELSYHPIDAFSYISYYGDNLIGVAVPADSRWNTLADLIAEAKANPGKLNYGTAAIGSTQHLSTEALTLATGAKFTHIPQQGSAGSMTALLGKHIDFITETSVWAPHVAAGRVRLLAVTAPKRVAAYPDVPTFTELDVSPIRSVQAIIGPAGLPEPVRRTLEVAFRKALKDPGFVNTMKTLAMEIVDLPGPEVKKLVEHEFLRARVVIAKLK